MSKHISDLTDKGISIVAIYHIRITQNKTNDIWWSWLVQKVIRESSQWYERLMIEMGVFEEELLYTLKKFKQFL